MFVSIKYDPERFKSLHSSVNTPHTGRTTRRSSMPDYTNTTITLSTKYNTNNSTLIPNHHRLHCHLQKSSNLNIIVEGL